jgi:hypothetical protein
MDKYNADSFIGTWSLIEENEESATVTIEKTNETYKCTWSIPNDSSTKFIGLGMLVDNQLLVSRIKQKSNIDGLPSGGIGVYKPIGDKRSNCALWANMQNFDTLGSGIALRQETNDSFEGDYTVRYFQKMHESPVFNLKIIGHDTKEFYRLTWAIGEKLALHGVGAIINGNMALAWGQLDIDWELVILNFRHNDNSCIHSSRVSLKDAVIREEILVRE